MHEFSIPPGSEVAFQTQGRGGVKSSRVGVVLGWIRPGESANALIRRLIPDGPPELMARDDLSGRARYLVRVPIGEGPDNRVLYRIFTPMAGTVEVTAPKAEPPPPPTPEPMPDPMARPMVGAKARPKARPKAGAKAKAKPAQKTKKAKQ